MKKKGKVEYTEELADAIITQFGLKHTVKRVWKSRGHIPGDYFDENRDDTEKLSDRDPEYQAFIRILSRQEIAATKFRCLGKKGADIQRGKDRMTEAERLAFKAEIVEIRNALRLAKDVPTNRNLMRALSDVRLHPTKIIQTNLYSKIQRDGALLEYEKKDAVFCILALYNVLRI